MPIRSTLLAACTALLLGQAAAATPEQLYQLALEAQSARAYPQMLDLLRQSARAGHVEAQEMLGLAWPCWPGPWSTARPCRRTAAKPPTGCARPLHRAAWWPGSSWCS